MNQSNSKLLNFLMFSLQNNHNFKDLKGILENEYEEKFCNPDKTG